jgi:hypothetical protein
VLPGDQKRWRSQAFFVTYLGARARLEAQQGKLREALDTLVECGHLATAMNLANPAATLPWRSEAALLAARLGPAGTIALSSWTPDGFIGDMLRLVGRYAPAPPARVRPPVEWGSVPALRELLGHGTIRIGAQERIHTFRHRSSEEFADVFLTNYGPTERAAATLDEGGRRQFRDDLASLAASASRTPAGGPVAIDAASLEAVAVWASSAGVVPSLLWCWRRQAHARRWRCRRPRSRT